MKAINYSPDTTFTLQSLARPSLQYEPSLFSQHHLHAGELRNSERQPYPSDWIVISFLFCIILVAWLQFFYFKRLRQVLYAPVSQRFLNILTKEGNLFKERISVVLAVIYLFTYSFLLSMTLKEFIPGRLAALQDYQLFMISAASILIFWLAKISAIRFLGIVFRTMAATRDYLMNILTFSYITGLVLIPLLILTIFVHSITLFYITLTIICLLYFFRVLRGFFIGISLKKFSYLFLFVYLCSLEILPLLIILKGLYLCNKGF